MLIETPFRLSVPSKNGQPVFFRGVWDAVLASGSTEDSLRQSVEMLSTFAPGYLPAMETASHRAQTAHSLLGFAPRGRGGQDRAEFERLAQSVSEAGWSTPLQELVQQGVGLHVEEYKSSFQWKAKVCRQEHWISMQAGILD